ncbi:MAG TPA: methanogenesis marker protein Mmp4/MtxX [Methanocorpusculum sp.]|nr:methanogenesis marker protein Mmp4/MtxX [Methanocorpusculum sp.]
MKIGIGCGADAVKIVESAAEYAGLSGNSVVCFAYAEAENTVFSRSPAVSVVFSSHPEEEMIDALFAGDVDAAVRGSLPANATLSYLKKKYKVSHLRRIALLETSCGQKFFFAPVGVDEGWTVEDKVSFVEEGRRYARACGLSDKAVVLAGGRSGDVGRHPAVDKSILDAEEVCRRTGAVFGEILIEDAVSDAGVVIAPDGISGNLIFRTLVLLGNGVGHGAPVVNIPDVYLDSSRAMSSYVPILSFTEKLFSLKE